MMTEPADCEIDRLQQTQGRKVLGQDGKLAAARGRNVETWPETNSGGRPGPQRWNGAWSGDGAAEAGPAREGECLDDTAAICPKLAEARAGQALAERQLVELMHRLVNVLQVLVTRIERQRRMQDDPAVKDEFDKLAASVHASAQLHRYLLPPRKRVQVDLGALLGNVAAAIEGVTGMVCDVEAEPVTVPGEVAMHLAASVNELAWNAYKHAYGGTEGGVILIVCRRTADARLLLSVGDRGRGLPAGFDPRASEGLGLMVVWATARQFGGEVRVESKGGARFTMLLPIPRM